MDLYILAIPRYFLGDFVLVCGSDFFGGLKNQHVLRAGPAVDLIEGTSWGWREGTLWSMQIRLYRLLSVVWSRMVGINFLKNIYLFYVYECSTCMYFYITEEGTWSYYRWATMWVLGIELKTSRRATSALYPWAISPAQLESILTWLLEYLKLPATLQTHS